MKGQKVLVILASLALVGGMSACGGKSGKTGKEAEPAAPSLAEKSAPAQMPARYQNPGYLTSQAAVEEDLGASSEAFQIRVGATIKSTSGPQPLWDVLKRLANLKGMTVSWASDVNQNSMVDVDINAQDLFQDAIANLLRQADYFHEIDGKAIVVKNKTTKVFRVGVPYIKGNYTSKVGGNYLPKQGGATWDAEGTIKLESEKNEFDIWANIQNNLDVILDVAAKEKAALDASKAEAAANAETQKAIAETDDPKKKQDILAAAAKARDVTTKSESRQRAEDGAFYVVDKATGSVTVTAKPSVMRTVENYFANLQKELYRQIAIEAKIIEVYLDNHSKIGIDWDSVLGGFNVGGTVYFGDDGQVYPWKKAIVNKEYAYLEENEDGRFRFVDGRYRPKLDGDGKFATYRDISYRDVGDIASPTRFISRLIMPAVNFNVVLNALDKQGETHVLSNPKLTVLNGQSAVLSVGKVRKYISEVEVDVDTDTNTRDYSTTTDTVVEGVSMGVIATIVNDHEMIMQLTPITTELEGGDIPYTTVGEQADFRIGLPVINMREMSTTVQVGDGEMLVIGGLIDSATGNSESFAPIVGKIPIIKYLFGYEEKKVRKRELVILLAPKIL